MAKLKAMDCSWTVLVLLLFTVLKPVHLADQPSAAVSTVRMGNYPSSPSGSSNRASASFVQEVVSHNCIVIFSKTTCPYCRLAKNVFNEIGTPYKVIELDQHEEGKQLQDTLGEMTGARTVPRVFVNGTCIGGGSEAKELHQRGKLLPLIQQCAPCCEGSGMDHSSGAQPASYNL